MGKALVPADSTLFVHLGHPRKTPCSHLFSVGWKVAFWIWPNQFLASLFDLMNLTSWKMPKDSTPWKESFGIVPNYFYDPNQIKRVTTEHRQRFYVFPLKNYQVGSKTQVLPSASRPTCTYCCSCSWDNYLPLRHLTSNSVFQPTFRISKIQYKNSKKKL